MFLLVLKEAGLVLLVGKLESRRDEVEAIRIDLLAELHRLAKSVFMGQDFDVWVAIAHFLRVGL